MQVREYRIPEEPGEVLCSPPLHQWVSVARENRRKAEAWTFRLAGWTASQWRERTRYRLWGQTGSRPVILTGHQPVFFHAGIWIKAFAAALAARGFPKTATAGGAQEHAGPAHLRPLAYHLNVDSDAEERLGLWLPAWTAASAATQERGAWSAGLSQLAGKPVGNQGGNEAGSGPGSAPQGPGRLVRRWLALPVGEGVNPRLPLERRPVPSLEDWARFGQEGRSLLESLQQAGEPLAGEGRRLLERWERFIQVGQRLLQQPDTVGNLARFLATIRQCLEWDEGGPNLGETWVSEVAATPEFLRFALAWFQEAPRLVAVYNGQLAAYRRIRRIRSRANPFPDLRRYGPQWETPFWCVGSDGSRADLFVRRPAESDPGAAATLLTLCTRHGDLITLDTARMDEAVAQLQDSGLIIRPKALALTLFLRLFACDLFVHGVGGGRYDHITDGVMAEWLGVEPPVYAVASAHLPLSLSHALVESLQLGGGAASDGLSSGGGGAAAGEGTSGGTASDRREASAGEASAGEASNPRALAAVLAGVAGEIAHLRRNLRDLVYNPQRFAHQEPGCDGLAAEKEALIQAINQPGAAKRPLTRRIEAVNAQLAGKLETVREQWEARLQQAQDRRQQMEVAAARDYPYFLFEPSQLWQALEDTP